MLVHLDIANGHSQVLEAQDLKHFSVQVSEAADREALSRALGSLGELESTGHAWIDIDELRSASGLSDDPEWSANFTSMVAYAASKGWVDDSGQHLRAHLDFGDTTS